MEDARNDLELVHVLRHSFRPSQPLAESIETFIKPGKKLPRLSLYGTKEVAVDLVKYNNFVYKHDEDALRNEFKQHTEAVYIDPIMHFRLIGSNALRMAFIPTPESTPIFNKMIDTLDEMPNILPPFNTTPRYFMYIDIPTTHLVSSEEWNARYHDLRKALASRIRSMYLVRPEDIIGQDGKRRVIPPEARPPEVDPYESDESSLVTPL